MKNLALIVGGALALAACSSSGGLGSGIFPHGDGGGAGTGGGAGQGGQDAAPGSKTYTFQTIINRDVDMLVMVDNSLSMKPLQQKLTSSFATLINVLQALPGGLPNLHLAVVSSNLGAGPYSQIDIPSCPAGGDQGVFQTMPKGPTCGGGSLMPGQNFIIANNAGMNNFTGALADTFGCIASLGDTGCGFEHQLGSVLRALGADGASVPPTNANFLRLNAYLFVVIVSNEDDCSAPPDSTLFDPASRFVSDPRGPLASYRCNEFGHICGGQKPPRMAPAMPQDLGTCTSAEDGTLLKVSDVIAKLKALKTDPAKVFVATIAGPPTPYIVDGGPATLKDDPTQVWAQIKHSCTAADLSYADPGVRFKMLTDGFGANGLFQPICNDSFGPALMAIGNQVGKAIGSEAPCLDAGTTPSQCTFVDHTFTTTGTRVDTPVPSCLDNGDKGPCWSASSAAVCGTGVLIKFNRAPGSIAPDMNTTATCPP